MSEIRKALAFVFLRKGKRSMKREELRRALSFDQRWMSPDQADRLIERARRRGLLLDAEGEEVAISFDPENEEVPISFRPTPTLFSEESEEGEEVGDLEGKILEKLRIDPEKLRTLVRDEVARSGGLFLPEVALLVVAFRLGVPLEGEIELVRSRILSPRKGQT